MKPQAIANPPNRGRAPKSSTSTRSRWRRWSSTRRHPDDRGEERRLPGLQLLGQPVPRLQPRLAYCYARPSHEYLSWGAGTDFDTKIMVKREAARLLRTQFDAPRGRATCLMFSGVTDCYNRPRPRWR